MTKGKIGLLLAAAAAYGVYKYSKLTPEQKKDLMAKGKDLFNNKLGGLGNLFGKQPVTMNGSTV
ncbi:MAG: hypothetical protein ABI480_04550 [Chitinophagaceae bacterium]